MKHYAIASQIGSIKVGGNGEFEMRVQSEFVESFFDLFVYIFRRKAFRNKWHPHQFHSKWIGGAPGYSRFQAEGSSLRSQPLFTQILCDGIHGVCELAIDLIPLVLQHSHDPVDLDINAADK